MPQPIDFYNDHLYQFIGKQRTGAILNSLVIFGLNCLPELV